MTVKRIDESSIVFNYFGAFFNGIFGVFNLSWVIYGAVLFFPVAEGPYPLCVGGQVNISNNLLYIQGRSTVLYFVPRYW